MVRAHHAFCTALHGNPEQKVVIGALRSIAYQPTNTVVKAGLGFMGSLSLTCRKICGWAGGFACLDMNLTFLVYVSLQVAGFLPRDPVVAQLVQQGGRLNSVPSLFITGTSDTLVRYRLTGTCSFLVPAQSDYASSRWQQAAALRTPCLSWCVQVPPDRTKQLFDCFDPSAVSTYTHSGAHLVPTCR